MDNCVVVTKRLLKQLKVPYTDRSISDNVLAHPDHPSLLAVSETLDKYHVNNLAVKRTFHQLLESPLPCLVQVEIRGISMFYVLSAISEDKLSCYDDKSKLIEISKEDFLQIWTGICLFIERTPESGEKGITDRIRQRRILILLSASTVVLMVGWAIGKYVYSGGADGLIPPYFSLTYFFLKICGLAAATVLLWYEIDQFNPAFRAFCAGSKKVNCSAVLSSKYAFVFGQNLSLSLLGFSYFFSSVVFLLIEGFSNSSLAVLSFGSYISVPVVIISVYYQAFVLKQWCKVCLLIQGVLLGEISVTIFGGLQKDEVQFHSIPLLLSLMLLSILGWTILKPLLNREKELTLHSRQLKKLKNNLTIFNALTRKSRKISTSTEGLGITIRKENAKYNVIKVCNPYCGPCAQAHPVLEALSNEGVINLQIIFTARPIQEDPALKPVSHLLAIDDKGDKDITKYSLDRWYNVETRDYVKFSREFPINGHLERQWDKIKAMNDWCKTENISYTPTIFIDGYELPQEYTVEDLQRVLN